MRWIANGMNDDLVVSDFVEDQKRIGKRGQTANAGIVRRHTHFRLNQEQVDHVLQPFLHTPSLRRSIGDIGEKRIEISERRERVATFHRPCLAQVARTCASVANSRRVVTTWP
jgi:hypothetical protein